MAQREGDALRLYRQAQGELCRVANMQIISNAGEKAGPRGIVRRSAYTTKLSNVDPKAWLADVLARIADHPSRRLAELLPWNRTPATERDVAKAA